MITMKTAFFTEGKAKIAASAGKLSRQLPVFYNPAMKLNRDISIALINNINQTQLKIADPLAGSGIRSIRFLLELKKKKIKSISINDINKKAVNAIKNNLKLNKINYKSKKISINSKDANAFLLNSSGFDYIDIDPFGSPIPFLDSAVKHLARNGILAVTATDTAALAGTYPETCQRKYWATPLRNHLMHEVGLRILIRKIQLIAMQYEKALTPILSYSKDHYYRIFFQAQKSNKACDKILAEHKYVLYCPFCLTLKASGANQAICNKIKNKTINKIAAGPLWTGNLFDKNLINKIYNSLNEKILKDFFTKQYPQIKQTNEIKNFIQTLKEESKVNTIGFYDLHLLAKKSKKQIPKTEIIIKRLKQNNFKASKTHFSPFAIKTTARPEQIIRLFS